MTAYHYPRLSVCKLVTSVPPPQDAAEDMLGLAVDASEGRPRTAAEALAGRIGGFRSDPAVAAQRLRQSTGEACAEGMANKRRTERI